MRTTFGAVMLSAIQFNCQIHFRAEEIENIRRDRMLSAKLPVVHTPASKAGP